MANDQVASFRLAEPADSALPAYDNTKLVAMNTCPVWGIVRYQMHKRVFTKSRNMPIECGKAMHEAFAWVRLCTLWKQLVDSDGGKGGGKSAAHIGFQSRS